MDNNKLSLNKLPMRYDYYQYGAETWSKIFQQANIPENITIIDLLSGWSPKVALGLSLSGFKGQLIAIDTSEQSLEVYKNFIDPIDKLFTVTTKKLDILEELLPQTNYIIGNHIVEDIILYQHLKKTNKNPNPYQKIENLKKIWSFINDKNTDIQLLADNLSKNFIQSLNNNGQIILSQYPGYQEVLHKIDQPYHYSLKLLTQIDINLNKNNFYRNNITAKKALQKMKNNYFKAENIFWYKYNKNETTTKTSLSEI